jgi:type I restriction enzyme M protein
LCRDSIEELKTNHEFALIKYIEWGANQVTKQKQKSTGGISWAKVPTVINRKPGWWAIPRCNPSSVFLSYVISDTYSQRYSEMPVASDRCFHVLNPKVKIEKKLLSAILNSSIVSLNIEMLGRVNLGEGALKFETEDAKNLLIPNPLLLNNGELIISAFEKLRNRPIKPVFEEVKMKDRRELDRLVLEAMGIDPVKYLQPIYDGLTDLVRERVELAAMRKDRKKARPTKDAVKLVEQVTEWFTDEGIKSFPADFLTAKPKPQDCVSVPVPDAPLKLGHVFMGRQDVVDGVGYQYDAPSEAAAKYIIYAHKPNEYIVDLPENNLLIAQAVVNYEIYLKGLFQKLYQELFDRTFNHKQAELLSRSIFNDLGLHFVEG